MIETSMLAQRFIGSVLTLYMVALCLRWLGGYIEVELENSRLKAVCRVTDPHIQWMRELLKRIGPLGPMDWGPIAALMSVWVLRIVLVQY